MFGAERKTPELGSVFFSVSFKEDGAVFGEDSYGFLLKDYAVAVVE